MLLETPFDYTDYVRPACLPPKNFDFDVGRMIISGIGNTAPSDEKSNYVDEMKWTTVPMCRQNVCKNNSAIRYLFKEGNFNIIFQLGIGSVVFF